MIRLLQCAVLLPLSCLGELITVDSSRGSVQGFDHYFGDDKTQRFFGYGQMFLGIPYAKAPLAERRFTLPEDICQYNDRGEVHNATYYRPRCWQTYDALQPADQMDEDCLYLNVMTPNVSRRVRNTGLFISHTLSSIGPVSGKYPVMVYIHGGTFTTGGADVYHWKGAVRNLVSRGVVVVTIQYRLGVIGFFTTFTEHFPPNRGFYDQILALRWVNEEIANFGGDSGRITIFGQSAGGTSVSDLSLSPLAKGLFHQLIQTSGSTMQEIETIDNPGGSIHQDRARQICKIDATNWGSKGKDQALLDCLQRANPQELIAYDFTDSKSWNVAIDGAFLPDYPENLVKNRPKYPALIGDMLEEAALAVPGVMEGDLSNVTRQSVQQKLNSAWPYYDEETSRNLTEIMINGFSKGNPPADNDHMGWTRLLVDINTGGVFSSNLIRDVQCLLPFNTSVDGWTPVGHCSDLPYLWFYPDIWEIYNASEADFAVANHFSLLWTDFAKNGELPFPRAEKARNYLEIDELISQKTNWRSESNDVFNVKFPEYLGQFPSLPISDDSWIKLREMGGKVVSKWNSMKCPTLPTPTAPTTTTSPAPTIRITAFVLFLWLSFVNA